MPGSGISSCWKRFRLSVMGRTNLRDRKKERAKQRQKQPQGRNDPGLLHVGCVCGVAVLRDQDGGGPDGVLRLSPLEIVHGLVQADIPLGACVVFVIVSPLMDGERLLTVQIGTVDAAHQSIRQQKTAVLNGSQHGNGGAELPLQPRDRTAGSTAR